MSNDGTGRPNRHVIKRGPNRRAVVATAALVSAALIVLGIVVFSDLGRPNRATPVPTATIPPTPSTLPPSTGTPTVAATTTAPPSSAPPSIAPSSRVPATTTPASSTPATSSPRSPSSNPTQRSFRYQPLWPFTSESRAAAWQRTYRSQGSQPWHLDAAQTAMSFTNGFLGFTEINRVVSTSVRGNEATVAVGYRTESTKPSIAAVIHLARIGQGDDAPWEVVGTRDTSFTLERPRYGAAVSSSLTVGGQITGVDEAIRIDVRQASSATAIGSSCCQPAGGDRRPWTAKVTFRGATDPALVVVASTGGHYQRVEKFAITAVRRTG